MRRPAEQRGPPRGCHAVNDESVPLGPSATLTGAQPMPADWFCLAWMMGSDVVLSVAFEMTPLMRADSAG